MATYARIVDGTVRQLYTPPDGVAIDACFTPDMVKTLVDVSDASPTPQFGWTATQTGDTWTFAAPVAAALSLADQARAAVYAGFTVALSGSVTLAATLFPTDQDTQTKIGAVITTVTATGTFPGGATSYPMKDSSGAWHSLTVDQYKVVAGAVAAYVAALDLIIDGNPLGATALPAASVSLTA